MTKSRGRSIGQTIGGVLVGFDEQVWSHRPPAEELVHHARPDDPVPAKDGSRLTITLAKDPSVAPHEAHDARRPTDDEGGR